MAGSIDSGARAPSESEDSQTTDDIVLDNHTRIEALVQLLVKKGLITEREYLAEYDAQFEDEECEHGSEEEE